MSRKSPGTRRLIVALASLSLLGQAIQLPTPLTAANAAERKVTASAGQGPEQRPLPRSAQARHGLGKGQRPPVEPPATDAAGPARRLSRAAWRRVATSAGVSSGVASARNAVLPASVVGLLRAEEDEPTPTGEPTASPTEEPAATATPTGESTASPTEEPTVTASPTAEPTPSETTPPVGDPELAARNLLVRPGYLLGDTSLVLYFDAGAGGTDRWASWQATVYDAESGTAQLSRSLSRNDLARCGVQREFCRAFGVADGWTLVEGHTYFATVTATLDDGALVTSEPSNTDRPRVVAAPPVFPPSQAARSARGNVFTQSAALHSIRGDGVDTATGSYTLVRPDLQLASYGVPFALVRTYSTQNTAAGRLGLGWASLLDVQVVPPAPGATAVTVRAEDGAEAVYPRDDDGAYRRPAGVRSTLRALTGGGWSLTRPDRSRYTFDADGRLVSVVNARGDGLRIRHAATTWTVTDAAGHEVTVTLRQDGLVEKVTLPDGRYVQYGYSNGQLSQVIDVMGSNWTYRYDGARLLNEVVDPRGISTTRTEYGADGRVSRQTDAEGAVTTFDWDAATQEATTRDADGVVTHDGYRDGVQLYTQNGNGDVNTQRYDEALNQSLLVDGLANQYERVYDTAGNLTAVLPPAPFDEQETRDYDGTLLTTVTDARGGITRYRHTAYGELAEVVEPGGARSSYDYDDRGLLVAETDQRGSVTRYTYDEAGNQTSRTTPDGAVTRYGHDEVGRQTSVVDPRGNVEGANPADHTTRFEYDKADRRIATRLPGVDKPSRTVYDAAGQVMTVVDVHGQETKYTYTRVARRIQSVTDRTGRRTEYAYTAAGRQSAVTDPAGGRTTYTYNDRGDLATTTSPLGNVSGADPAPYTTTNVYDANGFLVRTSIPYPGGGTASTDTTYDALRRPTSTTDPLGATTALRYDSTDNPVSAVFPSGATASVSYDADGRPEVATSPSGQVYSAEYDDAGNLVRQVSASGGVTTWTYDRMNRVSTMVEPRGNVEGADPADYTTRYRYDVAGNLVEVTDPLGHATSYRYDALDRLIAVTDADGRSVRYRYDALGRLTTVAGPDAPSLTEGVTGYDYDPEGRLLRRLDANGHDTKYAYDSAGRLTQVVPPLGFARDYRYDVASNVTAVVTSGSGDPAARTVTNTYDSLDRLVARQVGPDGPRYAFGYDAAGRLTSLADPTGTETRSYDVEGALTEVTRGDRSFGYAYDDGGNITRRTYPDGTTITSDYDRGGRLSSLDVTGGSAGSESAGYAFDYDPAGRLTTTTLPKGTGMEIRRGYDRAGRLTLLDTRDAAGDPVARYAFDLDTVGNPTQVTTTRGERSELTSYTYDAAYRLAGACYGGTGCDTATGSVAYTYDRVGNRLTETRAGTLGTSRSSYRYDNADQLTEVATTTAAGQETTSYRYDPEGNLISAGKDTSPTTSTTPWPRRRSAGDHPVRPRRSGAAAVRDHRGRRGEHPDLGVGRQRLPAAPGGRVRDRRGDDGHPRLPARVRDHLARRPGRRRVVAGPGPGRRGRRPGRRGRPGAGRVRLRPVRPPAGGRHRRRHGGIRGRQPARVRRYAPGPDPRRPVRHPGAGLRPCHRAVPPAGPAVPGATGAVGERLLLGRWAGHHDDRPVGAGPAVAHPRQRVVHPEARHRDAQCGDHAGDEAAVPPVRADQRLRRGARVHQLDRLRLLHRHRHGARGPGVLPEVTEEQQAGHPGAIRPADLPLRRQAVDGLRVGGEEQPAARPVHPEHDVPGRLRDRGPWAEPLPGQHAVPRRDAEHLLRLAGQGAQRASDPDVVDKPAHQHRDHLLRVAPAQAEEEEAASNGNGPAA